MSEPHRPGGDGDAEVRRRPQPPAWAGPTHDHPSPPPPGPPAAPAAPPRPGQVYGTRSRPSPPAAESAPANAWFATPEAARPEPSGSPAVPVSPPVVATPPAPAVVPPPAAGPVAAGTAAALSTPTMLAPVVRPGSAPASAPPAVSAGPDPEQVLAAYRWRFHHETLRELVDDPDRLREIRDGLTAKLEKAQDNPTRARLLSLRAVVSRMLGDLGKALADGKLALVHAEATGELRRIAIAQARLAHVLQWRGDFAEADRLFEEANSPELPDRLRATMHQHAGKSAYDQGRYIEACNHFEKALEMRRVEDPDLVAHTELALDAVFRKVAENGWGPYPRSRDEILQVRKPPAPVFDERARRWGYADPAGRLVIAAAFADVQPFRDGVAWVRRAGYESWELIDERGTTLVPASFGLLGVGSYADGLAWVSRDGAGGWLAIDRNGRVVISTGFDDVRPFRRGVAAVRRQGRWGAVDKVGRVILRFQFDGFATALTDGRYIDGFTDEGLAIVDQAGRKGVVDRTGRMIVPPVHPAVVIHPVAYLVGDLSGRWGALDRAGRLLIEPTHPSRTAVIAEIDRLLADTKPVL